MAESRSIEFDDSNFIDPSSNGVIQDTYDTRTQKRT